MSNAKIVLTGVLVVIAISLLGWGSYELEWFFKRENTERQVDLDNNNQGTQTAWRDEVHEYIQEINTLPENSPARESAKRNACEIAGRLNDEYFDLTIETFFDRNCT